jgi:hypothetical protein
MWESTFYTHVKHTECRIWVVNTPASYSGGPGLKTQTRIRLYRPRFSSVPPGKFSDNTFIKVTTASFYILFNSSFTFHPVIGRYIVWTTEKASLNKLPKIFKKR